MLDEMILQIALGEPVQWKWQLLRWELNSKTQDGQEEHYNLDCTQDSVETVADETGMDPLDTEDTREEAGDILEQRAGDILEQEAGDIQEQEAGDIQEQEAGDILEQEVGDILEQEVGDPEQEAGDILKDADDKDAANKARWARVGVLSGLVRRPRILELQTDPKKVHVEEQQMAHERARTKGP